MATSYTAQPQSLQTPFEDLQRFQESFNIDLCELTEQSRHRGNIKVKKEEIAYLWNSHTFDGKNTRKPHQMTAWWSSRDLTQAGTAQFLKPSATVDLYATHRSPE